MPSLLIADTTFEKIVQELPAGIGVKAREFRAFSRSRAVRSPEELLRAVMLYCGLDYTLREVVASTPEYCNIASLTLILLGAIRPQR